MSVHNTHTVSLTPEHKAFIAECLLSGRYVDAGGVVSAALRPMESHEPDRRAARKRTPDGTSAGR